LRKAFKSKEPLEMYVQVGRIKIAQLFYLVKGGKEKSPCGGGRRGIRWWRPGGVTQRWEKRFGKTLFITSGIL
jgi:hypothetical protein